MMAMRNVGDSGMVHPLDVLKWRVVQRWDYGPGTFMVPARR